jgi:hypothetical protein
MAAPPQTGMPDRSQYFYTEDGYQPSVDAVKGIYNQAVGGLKAYGNPL